MWIRTHPLLPSRDIDRTVRFYQDALGFSATLWTAQAAVLVRDTIELHFWPCDDPTRSGCRIQVADARALLNLCRERGLLDTSVALETHPWGSSFALDDPDGNTLWIFEGEPPWRVPDAPRNSA